MSILTSINLKALAPHGEAHFFSALVRYIAAHLLFNLSVLIVVTVLAARWLQVGQPLDPFVAYETLVPGASEEILTAFNCKKPSAPPPQYVVNTAPETCSIFPKNGSPFHLITVELHDKRICSVSFYTQSLQTEQLMQTWGDPQSVIRGSDHQSFTFFWQREGYTAAVVVPRPLGSTLVGLVTLAQFEAEYICGEQCCYDA